jgi:hypothetical protein
MRARNSTSSTPPPPPPPPTYSEPNYEVKPPIPTVSEYDTYGSEDIEAPRALRYLDPDAEPETAFSGKLSTDP